jgi:hypothetical protein
MIMDEQIASKCTAVNDFFGQAVHIRSRFRQSLALEKKHRGEPSGFYVIDSYKDPMVHH